MYNLQHVSYNEVSQVWRTFFSTLVAQKIGLQISTVPEMTTPKL